ncbi:PAS domain-containing protein [Burkholderia gladioli]|nr:PAS domain-containing methyl-accepting chemotaxis protein [Burkholderia gladioli]MBU9167254.1 PAS domain-containing protein [Burkholderia gladioli]MBU9379069.1 PAS domain-containing protein [Burkholderia gladioli]
MMRTNLPVTELEYPFPEDAMLVSATDLSSIIRYCNPAFIEVSGFDREELIGQPHNIIRHPDMPAEAFADLWATLRGGRAWTALVKNRRKDGSYYWVRANVTPIVENGAAVGYLSVRTRPTRAEIAEAEVLYAGMRAGGTASWRLVGGRVLRRGPRGLFARLGRVRAATRTLLAGGAGALAVLAWLHGASASSQPLWSVALAATVTAFVLWLLWGISHRLEAGIHEIDAMATRLAAGDLTVSIPPRSDVAFSGVQGSLRQLKLNLTAIVSDVRKQTVQLQFATREIAAANLDLSNRTEMQAAALQETAAALEQMTATVKSNSQAARHANEIVEQARATTRTGCDAVQATERTMEAISQSSKQIVAIVATIDTIAFQTNILALNAAVEAARAGESGRGFAVVAGEVRALAQRCAGASREIRSIVESNVGVALEGASSVSHAAARMAEIDQVMTRVGSIMAEVVGASQEQSQGIDSINDSVLHLDDTTQRNAALVEQSAATAHSLSRQAEILDDAVRLFTLQAVDSRGAA